MLWPLDTEKRLKMLNAIESNILLEEGAWPAMNSDEHRRIFLEDVRRTPSLADLCIEMDGPRARGFIAGKLLLEVWADWKVGRRKSLNSIKSWHAEWYAHWPEKHLSKPTIEKIWPQWRSVAPFWAAYAALGESRASAFPFPVPPEQLGHFLAAAKELRTFGVEHVPKSAKTSMLKDSDTFDIESRISLPPSPLRALEAD